MEKKEKTAAKHLSDFYDPVYFLADKHGNGLEFFELGQHAHKLFGLQPKSKKFEAELSKFLANLSKSARKRALAAVQNYLNRIECPEVVAWDWLVRDQTSNATHYVCIGSIDPFSPLFGKPRAAKPRRFDQPCHC